jgi:hypothetical protein
MNATFKSTGLSAVLILTSFIASTQGVASDLFVDDEKYLTIGSVLIEEVADADAEEFQIQPSFSGGIPASLLAGDGIPTGAMDLGSILNLGKQIWDIVEKNRPVANVKTDTASALPKGVTSWQDLAGWQMPKSKVFRVAYQNLYKRNVIDFSFRLLFTYGGNVRGKGKYLTNVTMVPGALNVSWGFTFNAQGVVTSVVNAGTVADPVAAMELLMKWSAVSVMSHVEESVSLYVRGDGAMANLSNGSIEK